MTRIAGSVTVQLNTAELKLGGRKYARAVVTELAKAVQTQAKHNVSPGVGPGPHPHKTWPGFLPNVDTGQLRDAIGMAVIRDTEHLAEAAVFSKLPGGQTYDVDLELGWQSHKGNRYIYPWLYPSSQAAVQGFSNVAKRLYHVLAGKLAK